MAPDRRRGLALAVLLAILAVLVYRGWSGTAVPPRSASNVRTGSGAGVAATATPEAPDVHLEALAAARPPMDEARRNPFQFGTRTQPSPPAVNGGPRPTPAPGRGSAPIGTSQSAIPLKFIGIVAAADRGGQIAVLSDSRGVYHGREGDIIEGRYRIVRIGAESIELAHVDGSGQQTIRLSGS
jgi:hypothetical protein